VDSLGFKVVDFAIKLAVILFAISFHESAHAWSALQFGDTTARDRGRISLNPIRHIDPFGSIVLPLVLYIFSGFISVRPSQHPWTSGPFATHGWPTWSCPPPVPFRTSSRGPGVLLLRVLGALSPHRSATWRRRSRGDTSRRYSGARHLPALLFLPRQRLPGRVQPDPDPAARRQRVAASLIGPPAQRAFALLAPFGFVALILLVTTPFLGWIFRPFQRVLLELVFGR